MALACGEHESEGFMEVGTPIYGALDPSTIGSVEDDQDWQKNVAFCERGLKQIPEAERHADELPDGINIWLGVSAHNGRGSYVYSFSDLKWERRLFSISRATLIRHLPEVAAKLL